MVNNAELKEVNISGNIVGSFFLNEIEQKFVNSSGGNVEFIYTFPIPENASVSGFYAAIGENRYIGELKEKEEALKDYQNTVAKGESAYMLESFRDNIFRLSLGNAADGETITVVISYIQDITVNDNAFRLLIPTLVSPRYIPGSIIGPNIGSGWRPPTDKVPDADFITPTQGKTGYKANFKIEFDLDSNIREISSPSHDVAAEFSENRGTVKFTQADMNSDFILNVSMYGAYNERFIAAKKSDGEYFSYASFVPKIPGSAKTNKEYIFLIDISGSMGGNNIGSAKKAVQICLRNIEEGDTFNIIAFESSFYCFAETSVKFDAINFAAANDWVDKLSARGGTEIYSPIKYIVEKSKNSSGAEKIMMLATDGQIGNEDEIIGYVKNNFSGRVFCIGIDINVNDSFLNKIAAIGNGFAEFYYPGGNEDLTKKVVKQFIRSGAPYIKPAKLETGGAHELAGKLPGCVYDGECYNFIIKSEQEPAGIAIAGENNAKITIGAPIENADDRAVLLSKLWAKKKIAEMDRELLDVSPRLKDAAKGKIVDVSVKYGVVCRYTSYIAVNERADKQAGLPKAVVVPVNSPRAMYDEDMDDMEMSMSAPLMTRSFSASFSSAPLSDSFMAVPTAAAEMFKMNLSKPKSAGGLFKKLFKAEEREPAAENPKTMAADKLIDRLYEMIGDMNWEVGGVAFADSIRASLVKIWSKNDKIDFVGQFAKLDKILSAVEKFTAKKDDEFDKCFLELSARLEKSIEKAGKSLSLDEIAGAQNFDGSFYHLQYRNALTLMVLNRLLKEGDIFVYQKQIKKTIGYLGAASLSAEETGKFEECLALAKNVGL